MDNELRLSDTAIMRIVQILQEGMMTFTDVTDLLRELRVEVDPDGGNALVLTERYKELVKRSHEQLLEKAERLKQEAADTQLLQSWKSDD